MKITINLVPAEKKEELRFRRIGRVFFRTGITLSMALVVFAVFIFFCVKVLDIYETAIGKEIEKSKENPAYKEISETQDLIEQYHSKSAAVQKQFRDHRQYWPIYQQINALAPKGIYFKEISIENSGVFLKGMGDRREAVINLKDRIEQDENFEKIESPISNYVRDANIDFEIRFNIKNW